MNAAALPGPMEFLAASVHGARRRYRKRLAGCQKKFSQSSVHDLRIETRRMVALLDLLHALGAAKVEDKLMKNLKKGLQQSGDLRDVQVQLEVLQPYWSRFPEAHGLKTLLQRRAEKLVRRLAGKMAKIKGSQLNHRLKELEKHLCKGSAGQSSKTLVDQVAATWQRAFDQVLNLRRQVQADRTESIHRLRVAFKHFRYLSELLQPLVPAVTEAQLESMKEYQARAGAVQDLEVLLARLGEAVKDRKLNPRALRNLRNELLQRKLQAIDSFMMRMDDLLKFEPRRKPRPASTRA